MLKKSFTIRPFMSQDAVLLILRIAIALLMLVHGWPKLMKLVGSAPIEFPEVLGMAPALALALAVFAEVLCSLFILVGFGTRLATIPLIITMIVVVFDIHAADPFSLQELGLHYLLVYFILLINGSGKYSFDELITRPAGLAPARQ